MFKDLFVSKTTESEKVTEPEKVAEPERRVTGKIIHVEESKGWGFISSPDIKFTRVFFHWSALNQDTLHFTKLKKNMKVEFTPKLFEGTKWRAIKIKVVEE